MAGIPVRQGRPSRTPDPAPPPTARPDARDTRPSRCEAAFRDALKGVSVVKKIVASAALAAALFESYRRLLREPILSSGANSDEATRRLPRDELLEDADIVSTRAISVNAPAAAVWPWARPDGTRLRRRLHVRLDREPARA